VNTRVDVELIFHSGKGNTNMDVLGLAGIGLIFTRSQLG